MMSACVPRFRLSKKWAYRRLVPSSLKMNRKMFFTRDSPMMPVSLRVPMSTAPKAEPAKGMVTQVSGPAVSEERG